MNCFQLQMGHFWNQGFGVIGWLEEQMVNHSSPPSLERLQFFSLWYIFYLGGGEGINLQRNPRFSALRIRSLSYSRSGFHYSQKLSGFLGLP